MLRLKRIPIDGEEFIECVRRKQDRAVATITRDGAFERDEVEARYAEYERKNGELLHARILRQEVGDGELIAWYRSNHQIAYATLSADNVLGTGPKILRVTDICIESGTSDDDRSQLIRDLLLEGMRRCAHHVEMTMEPDLYKFCSDLGAEPVKMVVLFRDIL